MWRLSLIACALADETRQTILTTPVARSIRNDGDDFASASSSLSLLQVSASVLTLDDSADATLTLRPEHNTRVVFKSGIEALESRIKKVQASGTAALEASMKKYTEKLRDAYNERAQIAVRNTKFSMDIAAIRRTNSELESEATAIRNDCQNLSKELHEWTVNMTLVQEFSSQLMNTNDSNASELDVLVELGEDRKEREAEEAHEQRLSSIAEESGMVSLLALSTKTAPVRTERHSPDSLLSDVSGSLEILAQQELERLDAVKNDYDEKEKAGSKLKAELLGKQANLSKTQDSAVELQGRLEAALLHLHTIRSTMQDGLRSLRSFAHRAGNGDSKKQENDASEVNSEFRSSNMTSRPAAAGTHRSRLTIDGKVVPKAESWVQAPLNTDAIVTKLGGETRDSRRVVPKAESWLSWLAEAVSMDNGASS